MSWQLLVTLLFGRCMRTDPATFKRRRGLTLAFENILKIGKSMRPTFFHQLPYFLPWHHVKEELHSWRRGTEVFRCSLLSCRSCYDCLSHEAFVINRIAWHKTLDLTQGDSQSDRLCRALTLSP